MRKDSVVTAVSCEGSFGILNRMTIKMLRGAVSLAEMEARRTGVHFVSDEERAAVRAGLAQANRGKFVPDELVAEADKRHDR
jgi:predicted transcriptional regulator